MPEHAAVFPKLRSAIVAVIDHGENQVGLWPSQEVIAVTQTGANFLWD